MRPKKYLICVYIYIYIIKKRNPHEAKKPPNLPLPIRNDWKEKNKEPKEKLVCHYPKKREIKAEKEATAGTKIELKQKIKDRVNCLVPM